MCTVQYFFSYTKKYLAAVLSTLYNFFLSLLIIFSHAHSHHISTCFYRVSNNQVELLELSSSFWFTTDCTMILFKGNYFCWSPLNDWLKLELMCEYFGWSWNTCELFFFGMNPCVNLTHQNLFVIVKFAKIFRKPNNHYISVLVNVLLPLDCAFSTCFRIWLSITHFNWHYYH